MRKTSLITMFLLIMLGTISMAFATVTVEVPTNYSTIASAVTWLNSQTPLTDSYVINVLAGHTETLSARIDLTVTGTATYTITIKKSGTGANPLITAFTGISTPGSATPDGMFAIRGADYVTIDGIDLYDPNTTNPATMEYGFGLFKASASDGAQYNIIKNCNVSLSRNNFASGLGPMVEGSVCILVVNSTAVTATTAITPTSAGGTNSYNKFYTNTLSNANYGIALSGYAASTPFTLGDTGNDVGGTALTMGNTILNFGGGSGSSNPSAGIRANNQWSVNLSYNTINNNNGSGVNHPSTLRGIYAQAGTSASANINNNDISLKGGGTSSQLTAIECGLGSTPASNTVNVNYNNIHDCTYSTATSATMYFIYVLSNPTTLNMNNNVIANNSLAGTGTPRIIYASASPTNLNVNYNQIYNFTKTGASGGIYCISMGTSIVNATYNEIHDITIPNTSGSSICGIYGFYNLASATYENYSNNQIYNLQVAGTNTAASTSCYLQGIYTYTIAGSNKLLNNNLIYNLQYNTSGSATIVGIRHNAGDAEVGRNHIYGLSSTGAASLVYGISIEGGGAGTPTNKVHNNMIHNLEAPGSTTSASTPAIQGIRISGSPTTTNVHYNSVLLNYNGANAYYATAGLYIAGGTTNNIRNNIFVNKCAPGASGRTVAVWKSAVGTTNLGAASDKNIYWVGESQDATRCVGYFATTAYPTIQEYKTALADREQGSFYEDVPFMSDREVNLHIDDSVETRVEGNAVPIITLCDVDYDNQNRDDTNPDIGADEGAFTPVTAPPGAPVYSSPGNAATGVAINAPLVWSAGADGGTPTSYEVYFGQEDPPAYYETVTMPTSNPPRLFAKTYYWKIKAFNAQGDVEGPLWSFSTADGIPVLTAPANSSTGVLAVPTFTWTAIPSVSGYKIKVGTTSGSGNAIDMAFTATNSYTPSTPLIYLQQYYWTVYSVNGEQEIASAEWSFTVQADPNFYVTLANPYLMDFEEITTAGAFPQHWTKTSSKWSTFIGSGSYARAPRSGTDYATCAYGSTTTDWMFSRPVYLYNTKLYDIGMWYKADGYTGWTSFKMYIGTAANGTAMVTELASVLSPSNTTYSQLLAQGWQPPATGVYFVGFQVIASSSPWYMCFDDFTVSELSADPVYQLTPSSMDFGSIQIQTGSAPQVFNIKNAGGGTLTIQSVSLVGDDASQFVLDNSNGSGIELDQGESVNVSVTFNPTTIGTKNASLKIVDNLSKTEHLAALTGVGVDRTIYDLPYYQTLSETPQATNWQQFAIGSGVTNRWSVSTTSNAGGTSPEWHCAFQNINPGTTRLVSPPIYVAGLSELVIKYRQQIDDYGVGCTYKFRYGYSVDSFFDVWLELSSANTTYPSEEKVFTLDNELQGHDRVFLCWEIEGNLYQYDHWYIDNIKFLPTNTEVGQTVAAGPTASVTVPEILVAGLPVSPQVQFSGLTGNPLINVAASYGITTDSITSERMVLTIDGGDLSGVTVTFTHGLGFVPSVLGYKIGDGQTLYVSNPGGWTSETAFFTIPAAKGPNSVKVIFPKDVEDTLPVELSSFTATLTADMFVKIAWISQSETDHLGYNILRSESNAIAGALQINPGVITDGYGIGSQISYSYTDAEVFTGSTYYYWLESVALGGVSTFYGPLMVLVNGDPTDPGTPPIPTVTELQDAYPNPFNPITNLRYTLKEAGKVRIDIFNAKGQLVRSFENDHTMPGYYQLRWDGKDTNGNIAASGIYLYRMTSGKYIQSKKMVLAK